MRCQMMELETVLLQQHEKKEGCRERVPGQGIGGEENNLAGLQADEWNDSASNPPIVCRHLPSKQLPHLLEVHIRPKATDGKAGRH
jgi:hypothetical protein